MNGNSRPAEVSMTDRINARHVLQESAERCRTLRNAVEPTGVAVIRPQALMTDLERIILPLTTLTVRLARQPRSDPRSPLEVLTERLVRVACSDLPAPRKVQEVRLLAARIAALGPAGIRTVQRLPDSVPESLAVPDLSGRQREVLAVIASAGPLTSVQAARALQISVAVVGSAVTGLERKHLISVAQAGPGGVRSFSVTSLGTRALAVGEPGPDDGRRIR